MEILTDPEQIRQHIRDIYKPNHFMMDYFHINIEEIHCGSATVSLKTDPEKHNNQRGVIHGGVFAALADSVTGVTSATEFHPYGNAWRNDPRHEQSHSPRPLYHCHYC